MHPQQPWFTTFSNHQVIMRYLHVGESCQPMLIYTLNAPNLSLLLSLTLPTLPCNDVERPVWKESSISWSWSTYSLLPCSGVSVLCVCVCEMMIESLWTFIWPVWRKWNRKESLEYFVSLDFHMIVLRPPVFYAYICLPVTVIHVVP